MSKLHSGPISKRGVSQVTTPDTFGHEEYISAFDQLVRVQWDYRDKLGVLHTGITRSLSEAHAAAAQWGFTLAQ